MTGVDVVGIGALNCDHIVSAGAPLVRQFAGELHRLLDQAGTPVEPGTEGYVPEPVMRAVLACAARAGVPLATSLGGSAFNALRTLAATDATLRTGYVGVAGQDPESRRWPHADELSRLGVDTLGLSVVPDTLSGACVAYTTDGARTLVTTTGANAHMASHIDNAFPLLASCLRDARIVHVTSFLDPHSPYRVLALLQEVKGAGGVGPLVSFDPGHVWCAGRHPAVDGLLRLSDYVLLNRRELDALAGGFSGSEQGAAQRVLARIGGGRAVVIVKRPDGTSTYRVSAGTVVRRFYRHAQMDPGGIRSDVGAGDAFAAGLLTHVARNPRAVSAGIRRGVHLACDLLSGSVSRVGR